MNRLGGTLRLGGVAALSACLGVLVAVQPAASKEKQVVTVSYMLSPGRSLPPDIKAVAVIDSGVESIDGIKGNSREKKWSLIAADIIEAMLQGESEGGPSVLTVVQRRATKQILDEQDLQLAGIVEGDAAMRAGKLLAVQGLIASTIRIQIETRRTAKSTIDWTGILGGPLGGAPPPRREVHYRPGPGGPRGPYENPYRRRRVERSPGGGGFGIPSREVEEISRNLTVQCSFRLIDATTGATVVQFSPPVFQKTDKKSPDFLFGGMIDQGDLDPVDHFIGELVERACREFVGMMAPTRVAYTYEIVGRGKEGESAVRAIRSDDYASAVRLFEAAHQDEPEECDTVFALGVTNELAGDFPRALECYRKLVAMEDVDEDDLPMYLEAKQRLTAHLPRIIRTQGDAVPKGP
ncbi:MAG TPA: hypothetical protein VJZ71_08545 [Phycisphaerae bacterium]|nr:hypothetical protein [Phycisphaerae bacterium]